ncbi:ABC transporter permease [Xylocopilactobacillus apicola]|uniref:ABC transporter permease n=1 Tax=Xylocopilactobacillus apicola TaxID=2932184 RepID=A0AAU9CYK2_9LACO|nr:ABC transporter permease [Xylocopilactobacillus apicola]BDR59099.1 ABC transporter permease [Xylocopilactobacillus apicola]
MNLVVSAIGQGLLWALLGLGLYLTFRILNFADMTVEGTFPLGAATAVTAITHGVNPLLATMMACGVGVVAGLITGLLYTKGKIPSLLAGILVMTAAYSINLRIMGKSNISLLNQKTLFSSKFLSSLPQYFDSVLVGMVVIFIFTIVMIFVLNTDWGQAFIATGDNRQMAKSLGIKTDRMVIMGLMISNGIVGVCGALIAQSNGYADINMGIGTIVIALASIIIGEVLFGELTLPQRLVAVALGSIIYRLLLLVVLQLGFKADDLNLLSSIVLALCMLLPQLEKHLRVKNTIVKGVTRHE